MTKELVGGSCYDGKKSIESLIVLLPRMRLSLNKQPLCLIKQLHLMICHMYFDRLFNNSPTVSLWASGFIFSCSYGFDGDLVYSGLELNSDSNPRPSRLQRSEKTSLMALSSSHYLGLEAKIKTEGQYSDVIAKFQV